MGSTIREGGTQHWAGKALSLSNERWLKRARGAALKRDSSKAYASKANSAATKGKHRDGILHKAVRGRPLRQSEKRFNKLISKHRFCIEQCFGTMKRLFGLQ
jgi:hypothetical protein